MQIEIYDDIDLVKIVTSREVNLGTIAKLPDRKLLPCLERIREVNEKWQLLLPCFFMVERIVFLLMFGYFVR